MDDKDDFEIDKHFCETHSLLLRKFATYFERVIENDDDPERGAFMATMIAIEIAARLACDNGKGKAWFLETAARRFTERSRLQARADEDAAKFAQLINSRSGRQGGVN